MNKPKILAIAPYEGLKELMEAVAKKEMILYLISIPEICQTAPQSYSRSKTAVSI